MPPMQSSVLSRFGQAASGTSVRNQRRIVVRFAELLHHAGIVGSAPGERQKNHQEHQGHKEPSVISFQLFCGPLISDHFSSVFLVFLVVS